MKENDTQPKEQRKTLWEYLDEGANHIDPKSAEALRGYNDPGRRRIKEMQANRNGIDEAAPQNQSPQAHAKQ